MGQKLIRDGLRLHRARTFTRKLSLLYLPLVLSTHLLGATTYFVATDGSDNNPGTWDQPFQHLSKGASIAIAGDTVVVMDGTYGNESAVAPRYVVTFRNSGTPDQPITFIAQHRGGAILDGMNTVTDGSPCNGASAYFNLANSSYIAIQGFVITRTCDEGIHNNDSAHHITIRQNEIHHIASRSITDQYGRVATGCSTASHDIIVDGNSIHDVGRTNTNFSTSLDHGLYMSCSNLTITNNVFYNQVDGWDIQLANGANNVLIANNTFASQNPKQPGQIMLWNSHTNIAIRNNIFFNAPRYAVTNYTARINGCLIDSNLISGSAAAYGGPGCSVGPNQLGVDPMFVDPASHNYQLLPGSPAIDAGINLPNITDDLMGSPRPILGPYDLGAYQSNTNPWISTPQISWITPRTPLLPVKLISQ